MMIMNELAVSDNDSYRRARFMEFSKMMNSKGPPARVMRDS